MEDNSSFIIGNELQALIRQHLKRFQVNASQGTAGKRAAVALTVVNVADDPGVYGMSREKLTKEHAALILTRRNPGLNHHAGQWALPGGRNDEGESPEETALRELHEEVGLKLTQNSILGRLDDFITRSGFAITPVVFWGGTVLELIPNPAEVGSIHRIPIAELMREDAPILDSIPESENPVLLMPIGQSWIASPTGAILYQFREVAIHGRDTRVAHFEQPHFAWQ